MKKTFEIIGIIAILGIVSYSFYYMYFIRGKEKEDFKLNNYQTQYVIDSLTLSKLLGSIQPTKGEVYVKPIVITNYIIDSISQINYHIKLENDKLKLINENLKDSLEINKRFLTISPKSSKLLLSTVAIDTLSYMLLDITGQVTNKKYPINLNQFSYKFTNDSLFATKLNKTNENINSKKKSLGLNIQTGYEILYSKPFIGVEIEKTLWKINFSSELNINIHKTPTMFFGIKAKYRIWE